VEGSNRQLTPLDRLFLDRSYELAARGTGNTSPNPPVGAVVVRDGFVVGEGYHHCAGSPHAESCALAQAGAQAHGATVYVSLEPCRHMGRTPPCTDALREAGIARVVAGACDPTAFGGGAAELRAHGIPVAVAGDPAARDLIEIFARANESKRPYLALKMAMSLDGFVASRSGVQQRLGCETEERYVRELRIAHDAVMVGAGTIRIDDPQLTVRPPHDRVRPYVRIVAAGSEPLSARSRLFAAQEGYAKTIVLAPSGLCDRLIELRNVADVAEIGDANEVSLDLALAMKALHERGVSSVLCEGGPRLGAALLAANLVDRVYWAIAPRFLASDAAAPVLSGADAGNVRIKIDRVERLGEDVLISGTLARV
jgi:diaminohydroxyphosphoribosylaminopyrimidine deaminase / 5-amino-6-(5-phosphoribosylamino)uracil reductase